MIERWKFLSTPSARRATSPPGPTTWTGHDFYPRPPRGGRLFFADVLHRDFRISIHALREEGDLRPESKQRGGDTISIHALREEGDGENSTSLRRPANFYPRPPRGGRPLPAWVDCPFSTISIHALREEGDVLRLRNLSLSPISIHALREEGDAGAREPCRDRENFYPRPPRGGRRVQACPRHRLARFLSTPSARRATPAG